MFMRLLAAYARKPAWIVGCGAIVFLFARRASLIFSSIIHKCHIRYKKLKLGG
jgi:hypothetical protein